MKKKLLVVLLAAVLVLGALGLNAFADTEQSTTTPVATAMWTADNSVTVNGTATETNWMFDSWIRGEAGTPDGKFAKLWNGTDLYFAVKTDGATSLKATLNTRVINVTLGSNPSADVDGVTVKQSGNILEMKVPFASIGFAMHGYTQKMPMVMELTNGAGTSKFDGELTFNGQHVANEIVSQATYEINTYNFHNAKYGYSSGSGDNAKNPTTGVTLRNAITLAQQTGQVGAKTETVNGESVYHLWNKYQAGKQNHMVQYSRVSVKGLGDPATLSGAAVLDFDVKIADLPEVKNPRSSAVCSNTYQTTGFGVAFSRVNDKEELAVSIANKTGVGLTLYVKTTSGATYDEVVLNRQPGDDTMHMSVRYGKNTSVTVLIDGVQVYHNPQLGDTTNGYFSGNEVAFTLWNPAYDNGNTNAIISSSYVPLSSAYDGDVYVSNVKLTTLNEGDLLENVTFDAIKGNNSDPSNVSSDLVLPTKLEDPNGKFSANLVWTSAPSGLISATGEVTPPQELTDVVLTATVAGTNPAITKSFNLTLSMPPIDAWKADAVTLDGNVEEYYNFARGYILTAEAGKPAGSIAARWTKDTLYIGAKYENTQMFALQIGNKIFVADLANKTVTDDQGAAITGASVSVGTGTCELALPLSYLNIQVTKGTSVPMGVIFGGAAGETGNSLLLSFYGVSEKAELAWTSGVTVDGKLEKNWQMHHEAAGRAGAPAGAVGQLWNERDLYLAIDTDGATSLKLTVAGKTVEIADLEGVPASSGVATAIAKDGDIVEMKIPFESFYTLYNYGQTMDLSVELTNSIGTSGYFGELYFSSKTYKFTSGAATQNAQNIITNYWNGNISEAQASGQIGYTAESDANGNYTYHLWNKHVDGKNHAIQRIRTAVGMGSQMGSLTGTITVDMDLHIADLPVLTDPTSGYNSWRMYQPAGFGINLGRYADASEELNLSITNMEQGLVMFVGYGPFTNTYGSNTVPYYGPFSLGKQVGDKFHLSLHYTEDGKIAAYVDNMLVMDFQDGGFSHAVAGQGIEFDLWAPYYEQNANNRPAGIDQILNPDSSPKNSGADMDVVISNLKIGDVTCDDLLDLLDFDTIKGANSSADLVMNDLVLVPSLTDGRLSSSLQWLSSKEEAVSTTGVVNTDNEGRVTLTAKLGDKSKKFGVTVYRNVVDAWKGSTYTEGRGYTFAAAGKPTGEVNARFDESNLYVQLENTNATKFSATLNGKIYAADVNGGTAEIKVPLAELNLGTIDNTSGTGLSVTLTGETGIATKNLALRFFGVSEMATANWEDSVVVDGTTNEGAWQFYRYTYGRPGAPEGKISALWSGTDLYLGINAENISKLNLTLNGKTANIDLATLAVTGMNNVTVKKTDRAVELKIPFASFDFKLVNYGQSVPMHLELEGAIATAGFTADLTFTAKEHVISSGETYYTASNATTLIWNGSVDAAKATGQIGGTVQKDANGGYSYRLWNKYQEGKTNYAIQRISLNDSALSNAMKDLSGIIAVDMDLCIVDMPVYTDPTSGDVVWRMYQPAGLGIGMGRFNDNNEELNIGLSNTADGLVLYVGYGPFTNTYGSSTVPYYGPFKLGKHLGDQFHLTFHYTEDGRVSAYVDDVLVMDFQDGGYSHAVPGLGVQFNLWNPKYDTQTAAFIDENNAPKNSDADTDVIIGNVKVGTISCYDLRDLITFDTIKGLNGSPDLISKNLTLPTTISDGTKLSADVAWSSSNTKVITNTGVVTTQDKNVDVKLTAKLGDFTKDFDLTVVLPTVDAWRITSANVNGTLAEYHDFTRGYTFPEGTVNGAIAARWNKNTLYLAGKTDGDTMTVQLGGKTIVANLSNKTVSGIKGASIAVGSGTVELGIPMSQLNLGTISQGMQKAMTVTFSKGSAKVQKQLGLTFYGVYETSHASWNDGSIAIDGILDEDWLMYTETTGRVGTSNGVIGKMWNGTDLFLAVDTDGASQLLVTMNGKTATIDLTTDPVSDDSGLIQAIAKKANIVEMKISFKDFFTLVDYGQVIDATIELVNEVGVSGFSGGFEFSSREHLAAGNQAASQNASNPVVDMYGPVEYADYATASGQAGVTDEADVNGRHTYRMWNKYLPGQKNYAVQRVQTTVSVPDVVTEKTGTLTLDFDVKIDDMPVYDDPTSGDVAFRRYQAAGLGILFSRGIEGKELNFVISNTKDGLVLFVGHGPFTTDFGSGTIPYDGPYKLNKAQSQEFHVMIHYTEEGEMAFYADDQLIYKLKEVGQDYGAIGGDNHLPGLIFSLWTGSNKMGLLNDFLDAESAPKNNKANGDVTISDVRFGSSTGTSILDLITYETIQNLNGEADSVVSNLKLPSSVSDGKITAKLSWTSSNRGVITNSGTVYPPEERTPVTMTVSLVGAKPAITKAFELTAVMPFIDTWQANFVKVDGDLSEYYSLTRGYSFAKASGKPSATIAAGWNTERSRLYYAINYANTDKITITMGSKVLVVDLKNQSVSGVKNAQMKLGKNGTVEIAVPLEQIRITEVKNNMLYDIGVKLENAKSSVSKNLTLAFYGKPSTALASWDNKTVVVDGKIEEESWLLYTLIQGRPGTPEGSFGRLWNGTDLYMAVDTAGAKKLTVLLGEKTLTVDLSKATPTVSGMSGVKIAKDGDFVELKIPMKSFGFALHNYTETLPMKLELSNAVGVSGFYGVLQFASREALFNGEEGEQSASNIHVDTFGDETVVKAAEESGQVGYTKKPTDTGFSYHMWNIYQEGKKNYPVQRVTSSGVSYNQSLEMEAINGIMTVDFDVRIDDMPEYKDVEIPDTFFRMYQPAGLGVFIGRALPGEEISFVITNEQAGLAMYMGSGPLDNSYGSGTVQWNGPYYIGKELGEQFHVSVHQTMKGEVQVYIDDEILYAFKDVGEDFALGDAGVSFSLWNQWYGEKYNASFLNPDSSPKNSDANTDVTISDVQVGTATCYDLLDYLDFDYIRANNGAYDNVISNLSLPGYLTDGKLKTNLTWESKKPDVVDNKGKVTTQNKDTTVILKAILNGTEPEQYKELEVSVALPPVDSWYNASVSMDGKLDEYHNFERGYTFEKKAASVGAAWDTDMMYVGIKHNGAESMKIKIEGKTLKVDLTKGTVSGIDGAKVAVGENTVEVAIPMSILREKAQKEDRVDMVVTLIQGENETEKGLRMSFYGRTMDGIVGWGGDAMSVDGSISEIAYQLYGQLDGRAGTPAGLVAKVWSGKDLYLAMYTETAKTVKLTLNGKTATINPSTLATTGNLISKISKGSYTYYDKKEEQIAKGTLLEMKIPFSAFGFDMYAYNLTADMTVEMENSIGVSAYSTKMAFTNKVSKNYITEMQEATYSNQSSARDNMSLGVANGNIGSTYTELQDGRFDYRMWNVYDAAAPGWAENIASHNAVANDAYEPMIRREGDWYMDFDVRIDDMIEKPKSTGHSISYYGNDGLNFWLQRGIYTQELSCGICGVKDVGLVFTVREPSGMKQVDFPIDRELGEKFHVSILWEDNGDITVYIDDEQLFFLEAGALGWQDKDDNFGDGVLRLNLWSTSTWARLADETQNTDFTVSNILIGYADSDNLLDQLTFDSIKGDNRRIDEVWKDLVLPSTATDGVVKADVIWESSNPAVISIVNGVAKVKPQAEDTKVTLTVRMKGNKDIYKTFEITVTCPIVDAKLVESAKRADPALSTYAKQPSFKLSDGSTVAAQWDKENIYLGVAHKGADTVNLTFGDKKIAVNLTNGAVTGIEGGKASVSGSKVEISLPRAALGIQVPDYHTTQRFTVELSKSGKAMASSALKLEFVGYESIADEYLKSAALKEFLATLKAVSGDLTLPQTYTSQFVDGKLVMAWESDTVRVLDNNGKLTRPEKVDTIVRLSLMVDGKKLATFDATIKAKGRPDLVSTNELRVPFGKDIKLDGYISEQGWSMNTNLATADQIIGKMGVQWDTEYLYMAFDYGKAKSLTLTIEGKTANINIANTSASGDLKIAQIKRSSYLELKIALKDLGLANITDYGEKLSAKVMLDSATFDGTFTLTSVQWFATDNPAHRYVKREDTMDKEDPRKALQDNSTEETPDYIYAGWYTDKAGYYMYDVYGYGADNKAAITTAMSFVNSTTAGTEVFAPMEQSGEVGLYTEFDVQPLSMPIYKGGASGENRVGSHTFMATAGLSWQIGGYANEIEKTSEWISLGMYYSEGGVNLAVRVGRNDYYFFPTGKQLGDMFRIGAAWTKDDTLILYVDGEKIAEVEKAVTYGDIMNSGGVGFRITRNANAAACESDSFKINISNIAMGYYYGECILDNVNWNEIRGENINHESVTMDLNLIDKYSTPQITSGKLTWECTDPAIAPDGEVTRPQDKSYALTRLTVSDELGHEKEIITAVKGFKELDDMLFLKDDYDMYHGVGGKYVGGAFIDFDKENQSVIRDLKEVKRISVVKVSALENENRMDEDTLTLWVSEDNANYTPVKFKILHKDNDTYLYGFDVEARYVKVHTTHFDSSNIHSKCFFPDMVNAYYEEIFGDNGQSFGTKKTVTVKNKESVNKMDMPWTFTAQELGIVSLAEDMADIRIFLGDELLYHYVEDGNVIVRIPEVKAGGSVKIKVLSGNKDAMDISNKEGVYEVLYGTREMFYISDDGGQNGNPYYRIRTLAVTNDGTLITTYRAGSMDSKRGSVDCRAWSYSKDNGRSWVYMDADQTFMVGPAPGGCVYDPHANILYSFGYCDHPDGSEGLETGLVKLDLNNGVENAKWEYVTRLSGDLVRAFNYNDGTVLSCYDGEGPNVDMLIMLLASGKDGDLNACLGDIAVYTTDAGKTWQISESIINDPTLAAGTEAGVSEPTTLELDDGTLVMLGRYQDMDTISFAYSYSTDHGVTWVEQAKPSNVYSVNTQPFFVETNDEFDILAWAGNNIQGGESYQRYPQNLAIPVVEENYENIGVIAVQNTYQRLYFQNLQVDNSRNTNLFATYTHDGALLIDSPVAPHVLTRVDDYKNYLTKTKGMFDSFENSTTKYEGWCDLDGMTAVTDKMSTDGKYSMSMFGQSVRSVPYFREGQLSFDIYWDGAEFKFELSPTYAPEFMKGSATALIIDHNGNVLDHNRVDTGIDVQEGWNKIEMNVDLPNSKVTVAANGSEHKDLAIAEKFNEYVCYIGMFADNNVYLDNMILIGEPDDVRPDKKDEEQAGFDLTAILVVGVIVVIAAAVAVVVLKKKKAAPKAEKPQTPDEQ